jgi:class 3 adenylate cyclase
MSTDPPGARQLLLEVLKALAGRARPVEEVQLSLHTDARLSAAMGVLRAEGLVALEPSDGGAVFVTTATRLAALSASGIEVSPDHRRIAIMFTDLVASSSLIGLLGEREAHAVRMRHFQLLRTVIARHHGREVKCLGDGLMVVFDHPGDALICAREMQLAVSEGGDRAQLRIGIDAGEPIRANGDYFGTPVIVAKRLCDAAAGGEILIADRAHEGIADRDRVPVSPRGLLTVKGFAEPVLASVAAL